MSASSSSPQRVRPRAPTPWPQVRRPASAERTRSSQKLKPEAYCLCTDSLPHPVTRRPQGMKGATKTYTRFSLLARLSICVIRRTHRIRKCRRRSDSRSIEGCGGSHTRGQPSSEAPCKRRPTTVTADAHSAKRRCHQRLAGDADHAAHADPVRGVFLGKRLSARDIARAHHRRRAHHH